MRCWWVLTIICFLVCVNVVAILPLWCALYTYRVINGITELSYILIFSDSYQNIFIVISWSVHVPWESFSTHSCTFGLFIFICWCMFCINEYSHHSRYVKTSYFFLKRIFLCHSRRTERRTTANFPFACCPFRVAVKLAASFAAPLSVSSTAYETIKTFVPQQATIVPEAAKNTGKEEIIEKFNNKSLFLLSNALLNF